MGKRSDCIEFDGYSIDDGYGWTYWAKRDGGDGRKWLAHRLAWVRANGQIPDGMYVCHRCDNPRCVNPAHLFLGTHRANMDDMKAKGRTCCGDKHYGERSSPAAVHAIRERYATGKVSQRELADEFGLSRRQILRIVNFQSWATV